MIARSEKGVFIVFEGIGGCGKDTQVARTEDFLVGRGCDVLVTREHTRDTPPGALIERIIKRQEEQIDPLALQLLYTADRRNHFKKEIEPFLSDGWTVIGNRYYATTVAYCPEDQRERILKLNQEVVARPDLVVIIDLDPVEAARRVDGRGDNDIFDKAERLKICRCGYEWYRDNSGDRCAWVDGSGTREEVHQRVLREIQVRGLIK